jgi:hypothetical protein
MSKYFDRFPVITYDGQPVKNILARSKFSENTKNDATSFIPHKIEDSMSRADLIANAYYEDPNYDWLYYYSNETVDPYHDVFKEDDQLKNIIVAKYKTLERARDLILFYRNNWTAEEANITTYVYENLESNLKKYYEPVLDYFNNVVAYKRKENDWTVSTNKVRIITVETVPEIMHLNECYLQYKDGAYVAKAILTNYDRDAQTMTFKCIKGDFVATAGNYVFSKYGSAETAVVATVSNPCPVDNIPDSEGSYWEPVSAYDYEAELNEAKRNVVLLRSSLRSDADAQLTKLMRT